jgi:hypothetical protein
MRQVLLLSALMVALYVGFALLALSQARHWRAIGPGSRLPRTAIVMLRVLGFALLAASLPIALRRDGTDFGSLVWGVLLSLSACALTFTLSWRPQWLKPLAQAIQAVALRRTAPQSISEHIPERKE